MIDELYRVLSKTGHVLDRFFNRDTAIQRMTEWRGADRVIYNGEVIARKPKDVSDNE